MSMVTADSSGVVLLAAALRYAARGWPVFPCRGKNPMTTNGLKDATTDPDQINVWWRRWPNASIGIATGVSSGLYVVDADADGAEDHLDLPPTLTSYTGKGRHYYYSLPVGDEVWPNTKETSLGPKMDSRGEGGYVIAPPSIHEATGRAYVFGDDAEPVAPLPQNVMDLIRSRKAKTVPTPSLAGPVSTTGSDTVERFARRYLSKLDKSVSGDGGHNSAFYAANAMVNGFALDLVTARRLIDEWNMGCLPPWSDKELTHKISEAAKEGHFNGRPYGCLLVDKQEKSQAPGADDSKEPTAFDVAVADLLAAGFGRKDEGPVALKEFTPATELLTKQFPPTPWLIRGLLTGNAVFAVAGEPKTTKTWAALEMAMSVATGTPAFGELVPMTEPSGVALFLAEDHERSVRNRLVSLAHARGMTPEQACERMYVTSLASLNLRSLNQLASLVVSVRAIPAPVSMLVLDPLRDLHTAEENSSTEMAEVTSALRALRTVLGAAVVFVHHSGKAGPASQVRRGGQMMRGSSVLHGAVDGGLYLSNLKGNLRTEWINHATTEVKGARGCGAFSLTLEVKDDEGGEATQAEWTYREPGEAVSKVEAVDRGAQALGLLQDEHDKNPVDPSPISGRAGDKLLGSKNGTAARIFKELEASGSALLVSSNNKTGWILNPLNVIDDEDDGVE